MTEAKEFWSKVTGSYKEISAKQKIMFKDLGAAINIDNAIDENESILLTFDNLITIAVHNEKAEGDPDYDVYLITGTDAIDGEETRYYTSSGAFKRALDDILDDIEELNGEEWQLKIFKKESKNFKGRYFITCTLV